MRPWACGRFPPVFQGSEAGRHRRIGAHDQRRCGRRIVRSSRGRPMRKALNENPMVQIAVLGDRGGRLRVHPLHVGAEEGRHRRRADHATPRRRGRPRRPAAIPPRRPRPRRAAPASSVDGPRAAGQRPTPPPRRRRRRRLDRRRPAALQGPARGRARRLRQEPDDRAARRSIPKGISDKKVEEYTNALRSRDDVEVFVVDVKDIADYSRITSGDRSAASRRWS